MKKVIFYPGPMHLFWTTGIYYLNELSKYFEVTLVLEKATKEDEEKINYLTEIRLKKIYHIKHANKLRRHWIYRNTVIKLVNEIKPGLVFAIDDLTPFATYLLSYSKKNGSVNICYLVGVYLSVMSEQKKALEGSRAIKKYAYLPFNFAKMLIRGEALLKHYWHYVIAPILIGHVPFVGPSSIYLIKGLPAMRDGDFFIVFSERDKKLCLIDGLPEDKIIIIPHPLTWKSSRDFKDKLLNFDTNKIDNDTVNTGENNVAIFLDNLEEGIDRETGRGIKKDKIYRTWKKIIEITSEKFSNRTIFIKPHPASLSKDDFLENIKTILDRLPNVKLVEKNTNALYCMFKSEIIISEMSNVLYVASLLFNDRIIISLDLNNKFLGDFYRNIENIHYISHIKDFEDFDIQNIKSKKLEETNGSEKLKSFIFKLFLK